jgi:hypothetical protein
MCVHISFMKSHDAFKPALCTEFAFVQGQGVFYSLFTGF